MKKPPIGTWKAFQIVVLAIKTTIGKSGKSKLDFSKPSVERLFERFLKKAGFSAKPGTTKSLSVEAAQGPNSDFRIALYLLQKTPSNYDR
jgi:hypothetical protein